MEALFWFRQDYSFLYYKRDGRGMLVLIAALGVMPQSYWIRWGVEKSKEDRKMCISQFCSEELCNTQYNRDLKRGLLLLAGWLSSGSRPLSLGACPCCSSRMEQYQ